MYVGLKSRQTQTRSMSRGTSGPTGSTSSTAENAALGFRRSVNTSSSAQVSRQHSISVHHPASRSTPTTFHLQRFRLPQGCLQSTVGNEIPAGAAMSSVGLPTRASVLSGLPSRRGRVRPSSREASTAWVECRMVSKPRCWWATHPPSMADPGRCERFGSSRMGVQRPSVPRWRCHLPARAGSSVCLR